MAKRNATAAIIGAGDFIGSEIAKKFAAEGFTVFAGRRNGDKLAPLVKEIEASGGKIFARSLDARKEEEITAFLADADKEAPLEVCIFNVGANVNFPILDTTERVFRKVWEMACYSGFLAGREAARLMLPREQGNIFFTGATASLRGGARLCGLRQRQVRAARGGAGDGARARAAEHPCRSPHHRFRRRYRMGSPTTGRSARPGCTERSRRPDAAGVGRGRLLAALRAAAQRLDLRNGDPAFQGDVVTGVDRLHQIIKSMRSINRTVMGRNAKARVDLNQLRPSCMR